MLTRPGLGLVANVGLVDWPPSFYELRRGEGCPMCAQGRPDETPYGARFLAGEVSDAYLQKEDVQRGYSVVIWRGRHVAEPTELSPEEASQYWLELLEVGRRLERLGPVKLNYDILGNSLPHLHTHVIPRYADDPKPGWPFPFPEDAGLIDEIEFRRDLNALRA
jgi:diadenosine tetraphosphate (Ap4A) HIT family hydrolase